MTVSRQESSTGYARLAATALVAPDALLAMTGTETPAHQPDVQIGQPIEPVRPVSLAPC